MTTPVAAATIRPARRDDLDAIARLARAMDELHARILPGYFRRPSRPARPDKLEQILRATDEAILVARATHG